MDKLSYIHSNCGGGITGGVSYKPLTYFWKCLSCGFKWAFDSKDCFMEAVFNGEQKH
jgi:hypothetical protein